MKPIKNKYNGPIPQKESVKETDTLLLRRTIIVTEIEEFVHLNGHTLNQGRRIKRTITQQIIEK